MLADLPPELIHNICRLCVPQSQARLARTCRWLNAICLPVLYKDDITVRGASCIYSIISRCANQTIAIAALESASEAGYDFQQCRDIDTHLTYAPMYLAARRGFDEIITFLLRRGVSPDGAPGCRDSPLFGALLAGQTKIALLLAEQGACLTSPSYGMTALHAAACSGLPEIAFYLVREKGMDANQRSQSGATAIMLALTSNRTQVALVLVELGADIYDALLYTCYTGKIDVALQLLETAMISSNSPLSSLEAWNIIMEIPKEKFPTQKLRELLCRLLAIAVMDKEHDFTLQEEYYSIDH